MRILIENEMSQAQLNQWKPYPSRAYNPAPLSKKIAFDIGMFLGMIGWYGGIIYGVITGKGWLFLTLIPACPLMYWGGQDKHGREYDYASTSSID